MIRADTHAAVSTVPSGTKPGRRVQEGPLRYPMRVLSRPPSWPLRAAPMGSAVLFGSEGSGYGLAGRRDGWDPPSYFSGRRAGVKPAVRALALCVPVVFVRCAFPGTVCVDRGTPGPRPGHISPRILCLARSCLRCRRPLCASSWRGSALHPPLEVSGRPRAPAILVYSAELLGAALHCIRPSSSQGDQPHRRRLRAGVIRSDPLSRC